MRWFNHQPKRNELQQRALETALRTYNSDPKKYRNTMFCPYCGSPLIDSGELRRLQTLSEHVSGDGSYATLKNVYICSAEGILNNQYLTEGDPESQLGCKYGILHCWNGGLEGGGSYPSDFCKKLWDIEKQSFVNYRVIEQYLHEDYKNDFSSALNTFNCNSEVSIYLKGLRRTRYLPAWLTFNLIQLTINYSYEADDFGRVTKTWIHLGFLKKDGNCGFYIVGIWPWHTWNFLNRKFKRNLKQAKKIKDKGEDKYMKALMKAFEPSANKSLIYRIHHKWISLIHPRLYKSLLKYFKVKNLDWNTVYELHQIYGYN